jgi:hypothetical protein
MMTTAPVLERTTSRPFHFHTSAHLLRIGRERASTLAELLDALRTCSDDSIFQHTFRTLHEHHFIRQGYSNDFAHWASALCQEPGLAERLANIDVREFLSLADLRQCVFEVVERHVRLNPRSADHVAHEPFYFCFSEIVLLPTQFLAHNLREFAGGLARVSVHAIHHHFIEARLRLHLTSNDFSVWLQQELGLSEAAHSVNRIDIYTSTLEDVRRQIVRIVEQAML